MRQEHVLIAVVVPIAHGDAHGAAIVGHAGGVAHIDELPVAEVVIKHVVRDVISHVQIRPPILVQVDPRRGKTSARGIQDAGGGRDFGEGSIAIVSKQQAARGREGGRIDARRILHVVIATGFGGTRVLDVARDIEIEKSVPIVVAPRRAGPESLQTADAGDGAPITERSVTVVVIQMVLAVRGQHQVKAAVVVIVAPGDRHPPAAKVDARSRRDVGERPITIVVIQHHARGRRVTFGLGHGEGTDLVGHHKIGPAVAIIVAPGCAGAHVLGQLRRSRAAEMFEAYPRGFGCVAEHDPRIVLRQ